MVSYETFYQGSPYTLEPNYGEFTGYRTNFNTLSLTTDGRTANMLKSATGHLNTGIKNIEFSAVSPEIFESVPKQHLKEINRLLKITGAEASVHGPLVEASGAGKEGWSETNREAAERQMKLAVQRSHEIDPKGNIPVTFHTTGTPGTELRPATPEEIKKGAPKLVPTQIIGIDRDSGKISGFKEEEFYSLGEDKEKNITPERRINMYNNTQWKNQIVNLNFYKKEADELLNNSLTFLAPVYNELINGKINPEKLPPQQKQAYYNLQKASGMLEQVETQFQSVYDNLRKYGEPLTEEHKQERINAKNKILDELNEKWKKENTKDPAVLSRVLDESIAGLGAISEHAGVIPKLMVPFNEFSLEKSSETFANVAFDSYKEFGYTSPIISIENPPAGMGLSTGEELKKVVEKSRENFIEKAVKNGVPKSEAKSAAKKIIGATWDVGHINMLRKYGAEDKDIIKETEKIAPFVKHVHLSDNFGFEHTELPMGMGNVPVKQMLEKIGQQGFKGKKVIEAISWWQHFSEQGKVPPLAPSLEAFGSPLYSMEMAPYWNQASGTIGNYSIGYGNMLPERHFSTYGAGWEGLPVELGGQAQGKRDRFSGAPMD
jgi:hypothetical protein